MWGNRFGWGISAVIVAAAVVLAYALHTLGQPTPPTGELVAAVRPFTLADAAGRLLPPVAPLGDAADHYRRAIADYRAHRPAYDALLAGKDYRPDAIAKLTGLRELVAAVDCPTMDLFRSKPEEIVNYDGSVPALDDLQAVANAAAYVVALAAYDKDYKTADTYATAVLTAGRNLYRERLTYGELSAGVSLMGTGSAGLKHVADQSGDAAAAAAQTAFDHARLDEDATAVEPAWKILSGQGDASIGRYAGDFFELANGTAADEMWRVEAVRRIGRLQLNAETHADNVRAKRYLTQLAADPSLDPVLHQAAVSGRDITSYQNQSQR